MTDHGLKNFRLERIMVYINAELVSMSFKDLRRYRDNEAVSEKPFCTAKQ